MPYYKTKEEAEKELAKSVEKQGTMFCPLIPGWCNSSCIAYSAGGISNISDPLKKYWCITPAQCTAPALVGEDR